MTIFQRAKPAPDAPKAGRRSLLGMLFNPQFGADVRPLGDVTGVFVQLVASVFSIYKLIPKNYPGLNDPGARLSLSGVIGAAWRNVEFTREGAPQAIMFFAVIGIMGISGCAAIAALLSLLGALLVGHAHAQTIPDSSVFSPESNDLAQSWMDYLFNGPNGGEYPLLNDTYGDPTNGGAAAVMNNPFAGSGVSLQTALMAALATYSDAILIVAALILFYHLTAMVVETAHHGVPMGKRASQIWAPIRLVVAIGLLVPVNGGLNCGQFIVVKVAELGSGLASQVWDVFLTQLESYNGKAVGPPGPMVERTAEDIIRMKACEEAWNKRVNDATSSLDTGSGPSAATMSDPGGTPATIGNISGTKYSFSSEALADVDICGWYFIPDGGGNTLLSEAADKQKAAIDASMGAFTAAAKEIDNVMVMPDQSPPTAAVPMDSAFRDAVATYQKNVNEQMQGLASQQASQISQALETMKPYGWLMAGAFLNTIDRVQAGLAAASADSAPKTSPPLIGNAPATDKPATPWWGWLVGINNSVTDEAWNIRQNVGDDMKTYNFYETKSLTNGGSSSGGSSSDNAQCAAMVGLSAHSTDPTTSIVDDFFGILDALATHNGVWSSGGGTSCGGPVGAQTFKLGIQFGDQDPFAEMAYLGHANIRTAMDLVVWFGAGQVVAGGLGFANLIPGVGSIGAALGVIAPLVYFVALIFWITGFILAFMLPLMPFMRFFFAGLTWLAAVIEAVIAIPLVALAHLNPEGEGLPGQQAKGAYFFIFNLFLRPVLCVFGLICGLILFLVAVSFLNYAYAIAVAGAGGSSYGMAAMSKFIYSILYVAILYVAANNAFKLINHLPERAMSWMGASAQAMHKMGDAEDVEKYGTTAAAIAGQQAMGAIGKSGVAYRQFSQKIADGRKPKNLPPPHGDSSGSFGPGGKDGPSGQGPGSFGSSGMLPSGNHASGEPPAPEGGAPVAGSGPAGPEGGNMPGGAAAPKDDGSSHGSDLSRKVDSHDTQINTLRGQIQSSLNRPGPPEKP